MRRPTFSGYPANLYRRDAPMLALIGLALVNGTLASPAYDFVSYFLYNFARGSMFFRPALLDHAISALLSLMTIMLAGIPAAIYERLRGFAHSTPGSLVIWLGGVLLLTLPALRAMLGDD
jgi:hypothetical protein